MPIDNKQCNKCSQIKSLEDYKKDPRNSDGRQGICKTCVREKEAALRAKRMATPVTTTNKKCNRCNETKSATEFFKDSGISDGLSTICKCCRNVSMNKWRETNRDKYNENMRKMRAANKDMFKNIDLKRTYGITLEQYNTMLSAQNGVCKVCSANPPANKMLVVDHCHASGAVRGLLCYKCNRDMVSVDNPEHLSKLLAYKKG